MRSRRRLCDRPRQAELNAELAGSGAPRISAVCFAPPACADAALAEALKGDVLGVIHRDDCVPRLSAANAEVLAAEVRERDVEARRRGFFRTKGGDSSATKDLEEEKRTFVRELSTSRAEERWRRGNAPGRRATRHPRPPPREEEAGVALSAASPHVASARRLFGNSEKRSLFPLNTSLNASERLSQRLSRAAELAADDARFQRLFADDVDAVTVYLKTLGKASARSRGRGVFDASIDVSLRH